MTSPTSTPAPTALGAFTRMSAADYRLNYDALHASVGGVVKPGRSAGHLRKKPRRTIEEDLHRDVFAWIFLHETRYPALKYAMHVPNGGARSKGEAGKLKAMGVRKGVSDIINPFPQPGGLGFACELKAPGGILSSEQSDFLREASSNGWVTGVCTTLEQFVCLIHRYLGKG